MIDIVVPIYDGYEETKACIDSLRKCKSTVPVRLILLNDCSPNVDIIQLLQKQALEGICVIENEKNLGFVQTVNKGMGLSQHDVIILNSDTIVTDYWVDKLHAAAYSRSNIGTVTALTNRGTIASVPTFNRDNNLPKGYTVEQFAQLVERVSEKVYPVIPTVVGHAMYICRDALNKVGLLDAETFGKGYCEENDFSIRITKMGLKNILADDTFIYHHGSTSFKGEKQALMTAHRKIIISKYPFYRYKVRLFLMFNKQVKNVCINIQKELKTYVP